MGIKRCSFAETIFRINLAIKHRYFDIFHIKLSNFFYFFLTASSGFVGCIRNVYLQGDSVDLISIVHSEASNGPILDGCHLVDFCKNSTMCEHNSKCVSDWSSMHCDCSDAYEGSACHFGKLWFLYSCFFLYHLEMTLFFLTVFSGLHFNLYCISSHLEWCRYKIILVNKRSDSV